jgi:hypothetical protein
MSLATYNDLETAIGNWLSRTDYVPRIPEFITLAEAEFNRRLRVMDMETRATALVAAAATLPPDFLEMRSITVDNATVSFVTASDFFSLQLDGPDEPHFYTIADGQLFITPTPSSGTMTMTYYASIPALQQTAQTNWLMTKAPDLYLFGALMQAEFYGWNDKRLPLIKARVDEIIAQLEAENSRRVMGASPVAPRLQAAGWLA